MSKLHITSRINGEAIEFLCEPQELLLHSLRDTLGLTGTKEGCLAGDCGACTVLMNGQPVCSCLVLAAETQDADIETIENLASPAGLHPLQRQFLDQAALQCGVCTPGFLMCAKALLDSNPDPDEEQARYYLAGNLCRCTGYDKIIRAVLDAARQIREQTEAVESA